MPCSMNNLVCRDDKGGGKNGRGKEAKRGADRVEQVHQYNQGKGKTRVKAKAVGKKENKEHNLGMLPR